MVILPPDLDAAIRAIQGESNLHVVLPVLDNRTLAQIVALTPDVHRGIRFFAALCGELPRLIDESIVADPALHDALAQMIGKPEGKSVLQGWAQIAPAGWGRAHVAALVDAVNTDTCTAGIAAALIGASDDAAAVLFGGDAMACAIRRWGQSSPDAPTAWMESLSSGVRERLIDTLRHDRYAVACCLPWLPSNIGHQIAFDDLSLDRALSAYAEASPTARAMHAELLQRLIAQAKPMHLASLTRLACAIESDEVWNRVQTLIYQRPSASYRVVSAAPWDDLRETVRTAILECGSDVPLCAAVAAAQGGEVGAQITRESVAAFFAALDPRVWDARDVDEQRRWLHALREEHAHLAVRSLGLRPEILVKATISDDLVIAAQRHTRDDATLRWALLPVALHQITPDAAHALIAALPTLPPDPGAFFGSASGHAVPSAIAHAQDTLHTTADLACAVFLQRCTKPNLSIRACCATLRDVLRGRSWNDLAPIMALLSDAARAALFPDREALVKRLAHPDRQEALRQAIDRLASLPPAVAIPTHVALTKATLRKGSGAADEANAIADTLHAHGDVFLAIFESLADDDLQFALLPLPGGDSQANALRALAHDDPPTAHRIAHALRNKDLRTATDIALRLPVHHRDALTSTPDALVERLAHPDRRESLRQALDRLASLSSYVDLWVRFALNHLGTYRWDVRGARIAAEDVAHALREHGDVFLGIVDAIEDADLGDMLLPQAEDAALAHTLRALACDDPPSAHHLGHALYHRDWCAAVHVLLKVPRQHAESICRALRPSTRSAIGKTLLPAEIAAADAHVITMVARRDLLSSYALAAALQSDDADLRDAGIDALPARPDILRVIWDKLSQETQQFLRTHPAITIFVADIPDVSCPSALTSRQNREDRGYRATRRRC